MQEDYSAEYLNLWKNHWWWQSRHELVMRAIRQLRKSRRKEASWEILDIGCGGGVAFDDFSRFGEVSGIEPDPLLAHAIPKWEPQIQQCFFNTKYQPESPFDLVLMLDVLEHIEHDEDALIALNQILSPEGFAIITVPALMSLWSAHDEVNHHFRRYTAANLETLLRSTGFKVHRLHYFFTWSLPLMFLRKFLAKKQENYSVKVPSWPMNGLFKSLSNFENLLRRFYIYLPIGSSLFAVVSRDPILAEQAR